MAAIHADIAHVDIVQRARTAACAALRASVKTIMNKPELSEPKRRNRNYEDTHRVLVLKAVELISKTGVDSISIASLARATRMNLSTVYYHFGSRDCLIEAVCNWSSEELAKGVEPDASHPADIDHISTFVLHNPELIRLWIDDYIEVGDIRQRYPLWDNMVAQIDDAFAHLPGNDACDAEVFSALMLTGALIAPRVFKNSVRPQESLERIAERFAQEQQRMLQRSRLPSGMDRAPSSLQSDPPADRRPGAAAQHRARSLNRGASSGVGDRASRRRLGRRSRHRHP